MTSETYKLVREAICKKKHVIATYDNCHRELCPHKIGWKKGKPQALFYQFAGHTSSGEIKVPTEGSWKCLTIAKLTNVSLRDGEWYTGEIKYGNGDCIDEIDLEVDY